MVRDLGSSIISLLGKQRSMPSEEIADALESDLETVEATLEELKRNQWVKQAANGQWRPTKPLFG